MIDFTGSTASKMEAAIILFLFVYIGCRQHHTIYTQVTHLHLHLPIRRIPSTSLVVLLLSGDIQPNFGPVSTAFNVCTLNIRSFLNPLKYTAISDLAQSRNIHLFAFTATRITPSATPAELFNATPLGFTLISCPRPASTTLTKFHIVGGGTAFLIREPATLLSTPTHSFKSFEMSYVTLKLFSSNLQCHSMSIVLLQLPQKLANLF